MDLLRGPGADRGPLPLGPRVSHDALFESLADLIAPTLAGADAGLAAHSDAVGRDVPDDIASSHAATIAVAEDAHADQVRAQDTTTAPALIDTGANTDAYHAATRPYLPPPDADIELGFVDLPPLPTDTGEGGPGDGGPPPI
jgi:hypothetical protein